MNSKKGLIIGSIVFVVIVACIVIVYLVFGFSSGSGESNGYGTGRGQAPPLQKTTEIRLYPQESPLP